MRAMAGPLRALDGWHRRALPQVLRQLRFPPYVCVRQRHRHSGDGAAAGLLLAPAGRASAGGSAPAWPVRAMSRRAGRGLSPPRRGMIFGSGDATEEFYPEDRRPQSAPEGPVVFGLPDAGNQVLTKARAKQRYLLRDADFAKAGIKPFFGGRAAAPAAPGGGAGARPLLRETTGEDDAPYLVADLERATLLRYGSEKEFRREQLRREIKRRRRSGRGSISDLAWDPALGKMPESVILEPVGLHKKR